MATSGLNPNFLPGLVAASMKGTSPSPLLGAVANQRSSNPLGKALASMPMDYASLNQSRANANAGAHPSVISRIIDLISRPLYAVSDFGYNAADAAANHKSLLQQLESGGHGLISGIAGTEKKTPFDWIQQTHDINAQKAATGDTAGYQTGQGAGLNNWEKGLGFGLSVVADPMNVIKPVSILRGGLAKAGVELPTIASLSSKAFKGTAADQATKAAESEAGGLNAGGVNTGVPVMSSKGIPENFFNEASTPKIPTENSTVPTPKAPTTPIPKIVSTAGSSSGLKFKDPADLRFAVGGLQKLQLDHPLVEIDKSLLPGRMKITNLTPEGEKLAAQRFNFSGMMGESFKDLNEARQQVVRDAAEQLKYSKNAQDAWIQRAKDAGLSDSHARAIVDGVNSGKTFEQAFKDAVPAAKVAAAPKAATKIAQALPTTASTTPQKVISAFRSSSEAPGLGSQFKLSSILSPRPGEILANSKPNPKVMNGLINSGMSPLKAKALAIPLEGSLLRTKNAILQKQLAKLKNNGGVYDSIRQAQMWNTVRGRAAKIWSGSGNGRTAADIVPINSLAFHMAAHIENELEKLGYEPVAKNGAHAKLTDALQHTAEFPHKLTELPTHVIEDFANRTVPGATEKILKAAKDAQAVGPTVKTAVTLANKLTANPLLSDPVKYLGQQKTASDVQKAIMQLTGSSRAARVGRQVYNEILANQTTSSQEALKNAGSILEQIVTTGKIPDNYGRIVRDLGKGIRQELGIPDPRAGGIGPYAPSEKTWLGRLATWYGQHDLRQAVLSQTGAGMNRAAATAAFWGNTFKGLSEEQAVEAIRAAQGMFTPANPAVQAAADAARERITSLFSRSGLSDAALKGKTAAYRSGLTKDELNFELRSKGSKLQFTDAKNVKDLLGNLRDFSKPGDWLNSWEAMKIEGDPGRFLMQLEMAAHAAMAKKALYQEFIDNFGSASRNAEQYVRIRNFPQLAGHYFSPEIAEQIIRVNRDLFNNEFKSGQLLRSYDNIMRLWKTSMTIYSPSHSIHNMMGDIFNSWMAGVNGARPYAKAIRVMQAHSGDYKDLEKMAPFLNPDITPAALQKAMPTSRVITTTKDGQKLTAAQIMMAARNQGILRKVTELEDISSAEHNLLNPGFRPFGGHVKEFAHGIVESADHFTRLAHFIDVITKSSGPVDQIFRNAAEVVRKYHPDGMDLTSFERNVLRRIIPFYSWTRKALPFILHDIAAKPGKFMVYPKAGYALSRQGTQSQTGQTLSQQFPGDQMFPAWLRDLGIGPAGSPGGVLNKLVGGPTSYVESSPSIPSMDILQTYGQSPMQGILAGLSPLIKAPIELHTGSQIDTGIPIGSKSQYIGENLPFYSLVQRLTNVSPSGQLTTKGQQQGVGNQQNLINYLLGLKLTNTGQYIREAGYEAKQQRRAAAKAQANPNPSIFSQILGG